MSSIVTRSLFLFVQNGNGLPVPRPTLRLISENERIALVETKDSSRDHTAALESYSQQKVAELQHAELCGYIVCAKSPSCGMERVKVYKHNGTEKDGVGVYTRILMEKCRGYRLKKMVD